MFVFLFVFLCGLNQDRDQVMVNVVSEQDFNFFNVYFSVCVSVWSQLGQRSGYGQSGCRQTQAATRRVSNHVVRVVAIKSGGG